MMHVPHVYAFKYILISSRTTHGYAKAFEHYMQCGPSDFFHARLPAIQCWCGNRKVGLNIRRNYDFKLGRLLVIEFISIVTIKCSTSAGITLPSWIIIDVLI